MTVQKIVQREPIKFDSLSLETVLAKMSEGNPGAIRVMFDAIKINPIVGFSFIVMLDKMGVRGPQIWIGYKDHCGCDIHEFMRCVAEDDPALIETINREGVPGGYPEAHPHGA